MPFGLRLFAVGLFAALGRCLSAFRFFAAFGLGRFFVDLLAFVGLGRSSRPCAAAS